MESESSPKWADKSGVIKQKNAYTNGVKVIFKPEVWEKIFGWCRAADTEISGMGLVKKEDGVFTVYDIFLPDQECTGASTEMEQDSLAELMAYLHKNKIPQDHMRCWMHTHYNFNVFWSQTDVDTIELLTGTSGDWMMSIVVNQAGDYKCRLDVMQPFRFAIDDIEVHLEQDKINNDKYKKDIEKRVKRPVYTYGGPTYGKGWDNDYGYGHGYTAHVEGDDRYWDDAKREWCWRKKDDKKDEGLKQIGFDTAKPWGPRPLSKRERKLLKKCGSLAWDESTKRYVDADKLKGKQHEAWRTIKEEIRAMTPPYAQGIDTGPFEFSECDIDRVYQSSNNPLIYWHNGESKNYGEAVKMGLPIVYYEQFKRGELTPIGAKQ